jgi:DNA-binding transcriptional MocR family regulator
MPLSAYFLGPPRATNGLVLGFASNRPESLTKGMEKLAQACEAARRQQRARSGIRFRARG